MGEIVTLVDDKDNIVGSKYRDMLTDDDRWRTVQIWVSDNAGNILVCKRADDKKIMPGRWEPGASGTVAFPESYEQAAKRELYEELGIKRNKLILERVVFYKSTWGSRALGLFRTVLDLSREKVVIQEEEISDSRWVSRSSLLKDMAKHPAKYVPEFNLLLESFT